MLIALLVLILLLAALAAVGFYMAGFTMRIQPQTLEQARAWQEARYDLSWYDALEKRDYVVDSYDGYALHVQLLRNPDAHGRYVLISHGYTDNRFGALKYARWYIGLGFNVIVYDLRGHGLNAPTFCTYSVRESRDLDALIRDSRARYADMTTLGLHGESLGAATSVAVLKYDPPVDFVVADCGFAEIASVLRAAVRARKMPPWMVDVAGLCAKLRYGYGYAQMRPIASLPDSRVPILFIHGEDDGFITPDHSERMRAAAGGYSELKRVPGAKHAASWQVDPEAYVGYLRAFLEKVLGVTFQTPHANP